MYSFFKLNLAVAFVFFCLVGSAAKAQLASDKSLNEMCNKKINNKLAEKNKYGSIAMPSQKFRALPSSLSSLQDMGMFRLKNSQIAANRNSLLSNEEKRNKLPSNSPKLKEMGIMKTRFPKSISKENPY